MIKSLHISQGEDHKLNYVGNYKICNVFSFTCDALFVEHYVDLYNVT